MEEGKIGYFKRVLMNDSTKRGISAAVGALLVAVVMEAVFPSPSA